MSQSYPENPRGIRQRFSRWNTTRRGTKTLKAAYAQARRDVKRMDPAVREQIGRAHMTRADLQMLAGTHVDAQFQPDRYGAVSQQLGAAASARTSTPAPTRNPLRRIANRYSRWRNTRQGTKALKAAFTQAARDVKRTDPAVRWAIGRTTINRSDLAALASSRMDEVFRPQGRFTNVPAQQQAGAGVQQQAGAQVQQQVPTPGSQQVSQQLNQQVQALQQSIIENQARMIALMEETNRLQAQLREVLDTRVQQLEQENGQQNQPGQDLNQQQSQQQGQQAEGPQTEPRAIGENTGEQSLDENAPSPTTTENTPTPAVGETTGEPAVGENTGEQAVSETTGEQAVGEGGESQAEGGESQVEGGEVEAPAAVAEGEQSPTSREWFASAAGEREFDPDEQTPNQPAPESITAETGETTPEATTAPQQTPTNPEQSGPTQQPPAANAEQSGPTQAPAASTHQSGPDQPRPVANAQQSGPNQQSPVASTQQSGPSQQSPAANAQQSGPNQQPVGASAEQAGADPTQSGANPQQAGAEQTGDNPQQTGADVSQGGPGQQQGGDKDRSPAALDTEMAQQHALSGQQPLTSVSNKRTAGA
ncbi:MAG TPA: hypothetical protein VFF46_02070, partial [Kribbella sp.]|nr:hypothetical protein [Kribbella sp.]